MDKKTRVILYVRVSGHEQAAEGYSVGEQTERLRKYADAMDWTVVKVCTDPGFTGSNIDRPALKELIRAVEQHQADKVVVYKLDRLSRSQKDTLYLIEDVFLSNGVDFVSLSENFDTGTPFGRAMIGILAVFAQLEREQIRERMFMGREARAKDGYYTAARWIILGYDYEDGELVINEYEAMLVREVFKLFLSGESLRSLARTLNERGLYKETATWKDTAVSRLLANRHYIGEVKFNKEWYPGRHEPIIDRETFEAAQRLLKVRSRLHTTTNKPQSALSGFVWCGKCGAKYHTELRHKRKDGTRPRRFVCYSRSKNSAKMATAETCDNKIYGAEELEEIIFNEVRKLSLDPKYIEKIAAPKRKPSKNDKAIRKELESIGSKISRLMDLYTLDKLTLKEVDEKIAPLTKKREQLEEELKRREDVRPGSISEGEAKELVASFGDVLDRGNLDEIRLVLKALIDKIVIYDDDIEIHWNFS